MSILNVNQIQPVGSGQTVTISATNISAGSATVTAGTFIGNLSSSGITSVSTSNLTVNGNAYPNAGPLSNRNLIINGNFAINQRGGSNTTINTYALDRWRSYGGPMGFTISQQDVLSTLSTSKYAMRFQRASGNTQTNNTGVVQGIESKNCEGLAGTQLTVSFKARAGADLSSDLDARFFYGTGTDENPVGMTGQTNDGGTDFTLTTSFATYTKTVTVPASTTQISLTFAVTPTGTAGTNDWFEVAEVQVERGSVATPFEHRSYGDELARCQRYYYKIFEGTSTTYYGIGSTRGTNQGDFVVPFPVTMRTAPTALETHGTASHFAFNFAGANKAATGISFMAASTHSAVVNLSSSSNFVGTNIAGRALSTDASAYLAWSAEL